MELASEGLRFTIFWTARLRPSAALSAIGRSVEGSKNGNGLAEHGRKLGEVSAEMAEAAAQAALSNNDDKKDHGCGKTCGQDDNRSDDSSNDKKDDDGCKKTCGDKDETKDPEQTQTTTRRPPTNKPNEPHETRDNKHDHDDPDYNYEYNNYDYDYKTNNYYEDNKPKVQHSSTVHTRHDYPAATTSVKAHREPDYTHRDTATRAVVVQQQPAKEVHHHYTTVKDADDNYNAEVNVAAERDVKVETPKELPSTGPELPITLSLGGMVAALIARKFFGP